MVREHLAAMEAIWSTDQAEYHGEFVDFAATWSWPKPLQQPRVRVLVGGGCRPMRCSPPWRTPPTAGSRSAAGAWRRPSHACGRWPRRPDATPAGLDVVPFGTIAGEGKLEHYAGLGVHEVVLRIRAGDQASMRAELESLAPLVPFAATLVQP